MNFVEIPFVKKVGIHQLENGDLCLENDHTNENHLNTIHASAQFTLAETASGKLLHDYFPDLEGRVIPVLRDSQLKFKRPAENAISAYACIDPDAAETFRRQLSAKGRGTIDVQVDIKDSSNLVSCTGSFKWFIQEIN